MEENSEYTNSGLFLFLIVNGFCLFRILTFLPTNTEIWRICLLQTLPPSSHQLTPYPPYPPQMAHPTFKVVTPGAPADTPPVPNRF